MTTRNEQASTQASTSGRGSIGPTSEATRRRVAASRARQGLPPTIEDPEVLAGMAQFLINAHRGDD
jgi:hypothetical protein